MITAILNGEVYIEIPHFTLISTPLEFLISTEGDEHSNLQCKDLHGGRSSIAVCSKKVSRKLFRMFGCFHDFHAPVHFTQFDVHRFVFLKETVYGVNNFLVPGLHATRDYFTL